MSNDEDRRREEARELLGQLKGRGPDMREGDRSFYQKMLESFTHRDGESLIGRLPRVSQKQLFWLRDLRDRYVLGTED